jgi:cytochrome c-type biogenesis protein
VVDAALLSLNVLLGAAAFFSPCGFPMLPAYLAYYLPRAGDARPGLPRALLRGLGGGLVAAAGALAVLLGIGALAAILGAPFKARVLDLELAGAAAMVALGALLLAGRGPSMRIALQPSQRRSALALAGFGARYAAVASSCVAPILLGVLVQAAAAPTVGEGILRVAAYAAGLCGLLVVVTALVATAQTALLARLRRALSYVERVSGIVLVLVGLYLAAYWWMARGA